jgi:hypothetical protein
MKKYSESPEFCTRPWSSGTRGIRKRPMCRTIAVRAQLLQIALCLAGHLAQYTLLSFRHCSRVPARIMANVFQPLVECGRCHAWRGKDICQDIDGPRMEKPRAARFASDLCRQRVRDTRERLTQNTGSFFTTKGPAGNGLGLSLVKNSVQKHHGVLRVRSSTTAGHSGTAFTVFLPCALG